MQGEPLSFSDVARTNSKFRGEGDAVAREFEGVVRTFNRVLQFKEKKRQYFLQQIERLKKRCEENLEMIRTLDNNIAIYDQNIEKILSALNQLSIKEQLIKERYEGLLEGTFNADMIEFVEPGKLPLAQRVTLNVEEKLLEQYNKGVTTGRDNLIKRRREYLEKLDNTFKKFDEDLFYVDGMRNNLSVAHLETSRKKEQALNTKAALESNHDALAEEKEKFETELESSVSEEKYLLGEYEDLIDSAKSNIEIKQETDQMLFSLLAALESEEKAHLDSANNKSPSGNGHEKPLATTSH